MAGSRTGDSFCWQVGPPRRSIGPSCARSTTHSSMQYHGDVGINRLTARFVWLRAGRDTTPTALTRRKPKSFTRHASLDWRNRGNAVERRRDQQSRAGRDPTIARPRTEEEVSMMASTYASTHLGREHLLRACPLWRRRCGQLNGWHGRKAGLTLARLQRRFLAQLGPSGGVSFSPKSGALRTNIERTGRAFRLATSCHQKMSTDVS